jgi:hypothetical protein
MWTVQWPAVDAGDTVRLCVSKVRDRGLRQRLLSVRPDVEAAAADYEAKATTGDLYQIVASNIVGGCRHSGRDGHSLRPAHGCEKRRR